MKTLQEALDFLESQPDVGKYLADNGYHGPRNDAFRCPVAKYLTAQGFAGVGVGEECSEVEVFTFVRNPPRVAEFIRQYDTVGVAVSQQLYGFVAVT